MHAPRKAGAHDLGERIQRLAFRGMEEDGLGVAEVLAPDGLDERLGDELHDELGRPVVRPHLRLSIFLHKTQNTVAADSYPDAFVQI